MIYLTLLRISIVYCDSPNWEDQWIQGVPLSKQPEWFKNNTEDPRSLYEQMNGPAWHDINDYYNTKRKNPKYLRYGWNSDSPSVESSQTESSNLENVLKDIPEYDFDREIRIYFNDLVDTYNASTGLDRPMELYMVLNTTDKTIWQPQTKEEFLNYDSSYNMTQRFIAEWYKNSLAQDNTNGAEFCLRLGTYILHDSLRNTKNLNPNDRIVFDSKLYDELSHHFLDSFCK